jgi:release factor glutamine methyltransferase
VSDAVPIAELLDEAAARLADASESPRLDAELLLARAIDMPRSYLYAHSEDAPDPAAIGRFSAGLERRLRGEPMAYITGQREFWSMNLAVTPATLVPRPETEILVEGALAEIGRDAALRILDLGTGSGAIALALAKERPECHVTATDISPAALEIARLNAREQDLTNLEFVHGDWLEPLGDKCYDLIVSNPPYICEGDPALAALCHEPRSALVAGVDGLDAIRRLSHECRTALTPGGALLVEHGAGQAEEVAAILSGDGWSGIRCLNDYAGLPRVTRATCSRGRSMIDSGRHAREIKR